MYTVWWKHYQMASSKGAKYIKANVLSEIQTSQLNIILNSLSFS